MMKLKTVLVFGLLIALLGDRTGADKHDDKDNSGHDDHHGHDHSDENHNTDVSGDSDSESQDSGFAEDDGSGSNDTEIGPEVHLLPGSSEDVEGPANGEPTPLEKPLDREDNDPTVTDVNDNVDGQVNDTLGEPVDEPLPSADQPTSMAEYLQGLGRHLQMPGPGSVPPGEEEVSASENGIRLNAPNFVPPENAIDNIRVVPVQRSAQFPDDDAEASEDDTEINEQAAEEEKEAQLEKDESPDAPEAEAEDQNGENGEILEEPQIAKDEQFPADQIPEQPKDVKKSLEDGDGLRDYVIEESHVPEPVEEEPESPEVDVEQKSVENSEKLENFKETKGGVAFDVNVDSEGKSADSDVDPADSGAKPEATAPEHVEAASETVEEVLPEIIKKSEAEADSEPSESAAATGQKEIVDPDIAPLQSSNPDIDEILNEEPSESDTSKNSAEQKVDSAYPSELDDDFSVDHKTGIMPEGTDITSRESDDDYSNSPLDPDANVMDKIRTEVDKASKIKEANTYVVTDELVDPIQNHHQFVIQSPSYRNFVPSENAVLKSVQETLAANPRFKRQLMIEPSDGLRHTESDNLAREISRFEILAPGDTFPAPIPFDDFRKQVHPDVQKLAEALEQDMKNFAAEKFGDSKFSESVEMDSEDSVEDSESRFNPFKNSGDKMIKDDVISEESDEYTPVVIPSDARPHSSTKGKTLAEILGIPEDKGPIMIEPEYNGDFSGRGGNNDEEESSNPLELLPYSYEYYSYEVPDKVIVETNKKLTIVYDDNTDSSESQSQSKEWFETNSESIETLASGIEPVPVPDPLKTPSKDVLAPNGIVITNSIVSFEPQEPGPKVSKIQPEVSESLDFPPESIQNIESIQSDSEAPQNEKKSDIENTSTALSKNLVLTLSISPCMLLVVLGFVIILAVFKVYFMVARPVKHVLPLTTTNVHKSPPISVISVDNKQPLP